MLPGRLNRLGNWPNGQNVHPKLAEGQGNPIWLAFVNGQSASGEARAVSEIIQDLEDLGHDVKKKRKE